jgi:fumarate reductase flavoprotein subunit
MSERAADLLIVGAGVAGWTAARRAQQLGLRVTILDKHGGDPGFGNAYLSAGIFHAVMSDPVTRSPEDLLRLVNWATDGTARPDLASRFAENVGRALRFLMNEGGRFAPRGPNEWMRNALFPFQMNVAQDRLEQRAGGNGAHRLFTKMWRSFTAAGGAFISGTRAIELITDRTVIAGVRTDSGDVHAANVLLADGGFHANKKLGRKHFGSDQYLVRGAPKSNLGEGLEMALSAGAKTVNMSQFYGHVQHRGAVEDIRLWPNPNFDTAAAGGLLVTVAGQRLGMGRGTFLALCHDILRSAYPMDTWLVLDEMGWRTVGSWGEEAAAIARWGARAEASNTLQDLARCVGMSEDGLLRAVDEHNRERSRPFGVPLSGEGMLSAPVVRQEIAEPPFHAVPVVAGVTTPLGGILTNGDGQVLREDEEPIPGLYAAGSTTGGLMGGPNFGYVGGWSQAATFGLLAAEHVAAHARNRAGRAAVSRA